MVLLIKDLLEEFGNSQTNILPTCEMGGVSSALWEIYAELLYATLHLINFYQPEQKNPFPMHHLYELYK